MCPKEYKLPETAGFPPSSSHPGPRMGASCRQLASNEEGAALSMPTSFFNPTNPVTPSVEISGQGMEISGQGVSLANFFHVKRVVTLRTSHPSAGRRLIKI